MEAHFDLAYEHFRKIPGWETGNEISDNENAAAIINNDEEKSEDGVKLRNDETQKIQIDETGEVIKKNDDIEVIRIPKIKLEGIKVVGKIDLPEQAPKKNKEIKKITENNTDTKEKRDPGNIRKMSGRNRSHTNLKKSESGKKYRELSYEEKLKREEYRKNNERSRQKKLKKEQKKQYYLKHVQSKYVQSENSKNKIKNGVGPMAESRRNIPAYRNPFKRFWAWLNGAYDKEM